MQGYAGKAESEFHIIHHNYMSGFIRNMPFFAASVGIHILLLMLITLKLNADLIKRFLDSEKVIEVELIQKNAIRSAESVTDFIKEKSDMPEIVKTEPVKVFSEKFYVKNIDLKSDVKILYKEKIADKNIVRSENVVKEVLTKNYEEPSVKAKILYYEKTDSDIKKDFNKSSNNSETSVKKGNPEESIDSSYGQKVALRTSDFSAVSDSAKYLADMAMSQNYELVRRLIEEKANRFVPVMYQKKLLEKKKRTAIVEIVLGENGYVSNHIIKKSTGLAEMDKSIKAILHLAEPYVYVPRPVDIELVFYE